MIDGGTNLIATLFIWPWKREAELRRVNPSSIFDCMGFYWAFVIGSFKISPLVFLLFQLFNKIIITSVYAFRISITDCNISHCGKISGVWKRFFKNKKKINNSAIKDVLILTVQSKCFNHKKNEHTCRAVDIITRPLLF